MAEPLTLDQYVEHMQGLQRQGHGALPIYSQQWNDPMQEFFPVLAEHAPTARQIEHFPDDGPSFECQAVVV